MPRGIQDSMSQSSLGTRNLSNLPIKAPLRKNRNRLFSYGSSYKNNQYLYKNFEVQYLIYRLSLRYYMVEKLLCYIEKMYVVFHGKSKISAKITWLLTSEPSSYDPKRHTLGFWGKPYNTRAIYREDTGLYTGYLDTHMNDKYKRMLNILVYEENILNVILKFLFHKMCMLNSISMNLFHICPSPRKLWHLII